MSSSANEKRVIETLALVGVSVNEAVKAFIEFGKTLGRLSTPKEAKQRDA